MKKLLLTSILTIFFLSLDFMAFAEDLPTDDQDENLEGGDAFPTPINGKIMWLAIIGIAFAYYTFKKYKAVKTV